MTPIPKTTKIKIGIMTMVMKKRKIIMETITTTRVIEAKSPLKLLTLNLATPAFPRQIMVIGNFELMVSFGKYLLLDDLYFCISLFYVSGIQC